jgi:hypothetical protein
MELPMSSPLRRIATAATGAAIVLGIGTAAFASTSTTPTGGSQPTKPVTRCVPTVPAKPITTVPTKPVPAGKSTVPAQHIGRQPTKPIARCVPTVPAQHIGQSK